MPQKSRLRITVCGQLLYAPVIILDLLGERADGLYYGPEYLGELGGQLALYLFVEARRRALGQAVSERFHRPAHVVDHLGTATDQRLARMDHRQVSLGVLAPVLHRVQKFRIGPSEAGQLLGIELVVLLRLWP